MSAHQVSPLFLLLLLLRASLFGHTKRHDDSEVTNDAEIATLVNDREHERSVCDENI